MNIKDLSERDIFTKYITRFKDSWFGYTFVITFLFWLCQWQLMGVLIFSLYFFHSASVKSIPSKVCKEPGIITRGAPRRDLEKRITRSLGILKRQNKIEEYKAKNIRIRLKGLI